MLKSLRLGSDNQNVSTKAEAPSFSGVEQKTWVKSGDSFEIFVFVSKKSFFFVLHQSFQNYFRASAFVEIF